MIRCCLNRRQSFARERTKLREKKKVPLREAEEKVLERKKTLPHQSRLGRGFEEGNINSKN